MTVLLTAGSDKLDMFISSSYDLNGSPGYVIPGDDTSGFANLKGQTVDGLGGIDTVTSDNNYGKYFTLTATADGVMTMTVSSGSITKFKNVEKFTWYKTHSTIVDLSINLGTAAADKVTGGKLADKFLFGLGGADTISGLGGGDWLMGGAGADKLIGGAGADRLTGGADKDIFDFNAITETGKTSSTRDQITDFTHGVDKIDLSTINPTNASHKFGTITKGTVFHKIAGELHYSQASGHTIISGDVNGDKIVDFTIDLLGLKTLTSVDFIA